MFEDDGDEYGLDLDPGSCHGGLLLNLVRDFGYLAEPVCEEDSAPQRKTHNLQALIVTITLRYVNLEQPLVPY